MHSPGVPHNAFRLPRPKSRYPFLPNDRSLSKEFGHDYHGVLMVVPALWKVKLLLGQEIASAHTDCLRDSVVDTLPLTELEGFLKFHHVLGVNDVSMCGKIVHLDENMTLWS